MDTTINTNIRIGNNNIYYVHNINYFLLKNSLRYLIIAILICC